METRSLPTTLERSNMSMEPFTFACAGYVDIMPYSNPQVLCRLLAKRLSWKCVYRVGRKSDTSRTM